MTFHLGRTLAIICGALVLASCIVVDREFAVTGGNRSEGTVELTVLEDGGEWVRATPSKTIASALKACKEWGYSNVILSEGATRECVKGEDYDCDAFRTTQIFHCLK